MTRDARQPEGVARPALPYSPVVVTGDLVFTAGQVALDARGDLVAGGIEAQTAQVLDNLARCLDGVGCSMEDVVKVTAFLADLADADGYNRVRDTVRPALPGSLDGRSAAGRQPARRDRGDRATGRRRSNLLEERRDGVDDAVAVVQDREYAPTIERRAGVRDPAHEEVPDPRETPLPTRQYACWSSSEVISIRPSMRSTSPRLVERGRRRIPPVERHVASSETHQREPSFGVESTAPRLRAWDEAALERLVRERRGAGVRARVVDHVGAATQEHGRRPGPAAGQPVDDEVEEQAPRPSRSARARTPSSSKRIAKPPRSSRNAST